MSLPGDEPAPDETRSVAPPATGLPAVDDALARLAELDERPVSEHPDRLSAAHEALHDALQSPFGSTDA